MTDPDEPIGMDDESTTRGIDQFEADRIDAPPSELIAELERIQGAKPEPRKAALRTVRNLAEERPEKVEPLSSVLVGYLTDEERSIRLMTAKLFVKLAESTPAAVVAHTQSLADRLADEQEFYFVRARCAEALGYIGLDHPDEMDDPAVLADLRIGLEFDEPEVKEKLAKALEHVALGNPSRLRHQVGTLADHLADDIALVRYHIATILVVIGCEAPDRLEPARESLLERIHDENDFVRGRALEALGLLARSGPDSSLPDRVAALRDAESAFVATRAAFATGQDSPTEGTGSEADSVGTIQSIRDGSAEIIEEIMAPDTDGACPHCGLSLPDDGPPICPSCGAPY